MSLFLSFRHRCSRFTFCFTITATIELSSTISFGSKSTLSLTVTDGQKNLLCLHETFLYFGAFCNWQTIIPNYFILPLCLLVEWLLSLRHHSCLMWIQTSGRLGCRYARTIGRSPHCWAIKRQAGTLYFSVKTLKTKRLWILFRKNLISSFSNHCWWPKKAKEERSLT